MEEKTFRNITDADWQILLDDSAKGAPLFIILGHLGITEEHFNYWVSLDPSIPIEMDKAYAEAYVEVLNNMKESKTKGAVETWLKQTRESFNSVEKNRYENITGNWAELTEVNNGDV